MHIVCVYIYIYMYVYVYSARNSRSAPVGGVPPRGAELLSLAAGGRVCVPCAGGSILLCLSYVLSLLSLVVVVVAVVVVVGMSYAYDNTPGLRISWTRTLRFRREWVRPISPLRLSLLRFAD